MSKHFILFGVATAVMFVAATMLAAPPAANAFAGTTTSVASSVGLPDNMLLYQQDPFPNDNTVPNTSGYCPVTPIGGVATDGSSLYRAGAGSNCVAVENLVLNSQRTELAGLVGNYSLWLYDVHSDGTVTGSPNQKYNYDTPRCNAGVNLGWTPDGSTVTCFWQAGMSWENVLTGATGYIPAAQLGVPTNSTSSAIWLPNGNLLASGPVAGCTGTGQWSIPMSGLTPSGPATVVGSVCPTEKKYRITLSPDGSTLAYGASSADGSIDAVAVSAVDGSGERVVLNQTQAAYDYTLAWSPDGRYLLAGTSLGSVPSVPYFYGGRYRSGISAINVATGAVHWVLPPQATFDARFPVSANVPDTTPANLLAAPVTAVTAVNGDAGLISAAAGDTLSIAGSGFDPNNPPTNVTVCDSTGTTCLRVPAEHITIDSLGNLACTVVIPATWAPTSSSGGQTTGIPGGTQSTTGLAFPVGPSAPQPKPSPGLYLSPNHGVPNTVTSVGIDYLAASQSVQIAAFASADGSGSPLSGAIAATADQCGCLTTTFTVPAGTHSIAALSTANGAVIAFSAWHPDETTAPASLIDAIDAGGGGAAGPYSADAGFSGGTPYSSSASVDMSAVQNPAPQTVYQSVRYGNAFSYAYSGLTPGATYTVRLDFNELYWGTALSGSGGVGSRVFDVAINGQSALNNFDIYAAAGGSNRAITEQASTTADSNGNITVNFTTVTDNAMVNGLELFSGTLPPLPTPPTATSAYINAGGNSVGAFGGDNGFNGGTTYSSSASVNTTQVASPAPQAVYQTVRYGNAFGYTVSNLAPNTSFTVRLDFNELYWGTPLAGNSGGVGSRVFNVSINGNGVLNNFDIFAAAGGANQAIAEQFATTSDANGRITIQFSTIADNAMVNGIELAQ